MWHIDPTVVRLLDGSRAYLHAVIDNFSRRIVAWRVAETFGSAFSPKKLGPVLEPKVGHALELRGVVRDQLQPRGTGVGRDEQIVGPDHGSSTLQDGTDLSVVKRHILVERNGLYVR